MSQDTWHQLNSEMDKLIDQWTGSAAVADEKMTLKAAASHALQTPDIDLPALPDELKTACNTLLSRKHLPETKKQIMG